MYKRFLFCLVKTNNVTSMKYLTFVLLQCVCFMCFTRLLFGTDPLADSGTRIPASCSFTEKSMNEVTSSHRAGQSQASPWSPHHRQLVT